MMYLELAGSATVIKTNVPELYPDSKRLTVAEGKRRIREYARAQLRKLLRPGSRVYGIVRHVAKSGMSRDIDFYLIRKGEIFSLSWLIASVLDERQTKDGALHIEGCGMDMLWHTVHNLGRALWPNGTRKPHGTRNGEPDSDGGFALQCSQL